ncbi:MAG: DUF4412 domain-containing protein [Pyrinomonadaceae bacterium]|nr:DUF4412 domain-containing protein [Pyrinomonadaceae bacterium]
MKQRISIIAAIILSLACFQTAFADVRVKAKQTMAGQTYENTTYIKGKRQRTETMSGMMVNITQCDLRRAIQMNPAAKTFIVNEFGEIETIGEKPVNAKTGGPVTKGGRVLTTVTIKDTGERKQMFGFAARHLIITMDTQSSPDSCSKTNMRMETDGWYIDFEPGFDCDQYNNPRSYTPPTAGGCQDKYEMKTIGTGKRGYPLYEKMTMFDESGRETMSYVTEVVELSKASLDASLFDVPSDYRQVSDTSQLYSGMGSVSRSTASTTGVSTGDNSSSASSPRANSIAASGRPNTEQTPAASLGAKQAGVIRIGLAEVKTGSIGEGLSASDLAVAIENTLVQYLKVPNVEVVALDAKLASAIEAEARAKECDFVLYTTVSHKKGGGGFGKMFGSALGSAVARTGIGHTGSTAGNIAGQVATQTIVSVASVSAQMKNKDELSLDIKFNATASGPGMSKTFKTKAKSDGDDIISAVVEQAAQAVVDSLKK